MRKENIVLVGFMGCGKTTIGKKLARANDCVFIDMDDEIEKRAGMKITDIFEKYGEAEFRKMETELCEELSVRQGCVIATGGGVIKSEKNMELLKKNGIVLYIKASPEHIYNNIRGDKSRPLLNGGNKMKKIRDMMEERRPLYEERSDVEADITGMKSSEAVGLIMDILREMEK
ncbi:MAG: shikimate kinase [Clostridiales bacterium]|nr:shikimate kinase [Clostridiales bacterium]